MYGKKLSRQIARYLGHDATELDLTNLLAFLREAAIPDLPPRDRELLKNIPVLLNIVDTSYQKYEDNIALAERNLAISSEELLQANHSISLMVNCLGQGFLMFDESLICAPVYSQACLALLETTPAGKHIASVLRLDADKADRLTSLLGQAFRGSHAMSFEEIMRFAPRSFKHSEGRHIELDYKNEEDGSGRLKHVVVIATDITDRIQALTLAEERKNSFESIERALHDRLAFGSHIRQAQEFIDKLLSGAADDALGLQREAHTLKASAGVFRLMRLMNALHDFETMIRTHQELHAGQPLPPAELMRFGKLMETKLGDTQRHFKNVLGIDIFKLEGESGISKKAAYDFAGYLRNKNLPDLRRDYIERVCAESLTGHLTRYDLYIHDLAERFNKKAHPIRFVGGDIPLVPDRYKAFLESFVHIFRNIMDYGIEMPDERKAGGKDECGTIEVKMGLYADDKEQLRLRLEIADDGAGVSIPRLRAKLAAAWPKTKWGDQPDAEVLQTILTHRISTRDAATHYSGRGLGMNIVHEETLKLGGTISVRSEDGKGTAFTIEVPYILDI